MKYKEISDFVGKGIAKVRITLADGRKVVKRIFISTRNGHFVCECARKSTTSGYIIREDDYERNWVSMVKVGSNVNLVSRMKKRANDALRMLTESELWSDIKDEIVEFLKLSDDVIKSDFVEVSPYKTYNTKKYKWLHTYQVFESFKASVCWKAPSFDKWDLNKASVITNVQNAIILKRDFSCRWRNKYDNSISIKQDNGHGIARGWYSEEYKNCGNGHYYLLFDAKHAIFYEDD